MREEVRETMKHRMFGIIALVVVVVSALSLPQALAAPKAGRISPQLPTRYTIRGVSNPSGSCSSLGLKGFNGDLVVENGQLFIGLVNANAGNTYSVKIGHKASNGGCDGTWKQLGSVHVDFMGEGALTVTQKLSSGTQYILEFSDGSGTPMYATPFISI
jgi:hypothetical protein